MVAQSSRKGRCPTPKEGHIMMMKEKDTRSDIKVGASRYAALDIEEEMSEGVETVGAFSRPILEFSNSKGEKKGSGDDLGKTKKVIGGLKDQKKDKRSTCSAGVQGGKKEDKVVYRADTNELSKSNITLIQVEAQERPIVSSVVQERGSNIRPKETKQVEMNYRLKLYALGQKAIKESGLVEIQESEMDEHIVDHFLGNLPIQDNTHMVCEEVEPPDRDEPMEILGLAEVEEQVVGREGTLGNLIDQPNISQ